MDEINYTHFLQHAWDHFKPVEPPRFKGSPENLKTVARFIDIALENSRVGDPGHWAVSIAGQAWWNYKQTRDNGPDWREKLEESINFKP